MPSNDKHQQSESTEIQVGANATQEGKSVVFDELLPVITALASNGPTTWVRHLGAAIQDARTSGLLEALQAGYERLKAAGRIEDDYQETEQARTNFLILINGIADQNASETRLRALSNIFLRAATEELSDRDDPLPTALMNLVLTMSEEELLLLGTAFRVAASEKWRDQGEDHWSAQSWLEFAASESGLRHAALAEIYERELMKKNLLSGRTYNDESGITMGSQFRLTGLGIDLGKFAIDSADDSLSRSDA